MPQQKWGSRLLALGWLNGETLDQGQTPARKGRSVMTRRFAANNSRVSLSKAGHRKNRRVSGAQGTDATFPIGQPSAVTAGKEGCDHRRGGGRRGCPGRGALRG